MTADEIVKALRKCSRTQPESCSDCPYYSVAYCIRKVRLDAADAIEQLSMAHSNEETEAMK